MRTIIFIFLFYISSLEGKEIQVFKSAKNKEMNYFERFEYIEDYLSNLSKDYLKKDNLDDKLEKQKEKIKALQKKIEQNEKILSLYKEKIDKIDEKKFIDLKRKVDRIDNVELNRMYIKMRNLRYKIDSIESRKTKEKKE